MTNHVYGRISRLTVLVLIAGALLGGCNLFGSSSDSPAGPAGGGGSGSTASQNLQNMPKPTVTLPASLAAGGASASSNTIGALAMGDIAEVTIQTLPDVKANGWYELKDKTEVSEMLTAFVTELRQIASERELEFDTVYTLGQRDFYDGNYDMGNMKLTGVSADDFTVWWYPKPFAAWDSYIRLDILRTGDEWEVEMLSTFIQGPDDPFGEPGTKYDYAYYNTASGDSSLAYVYELIDGSIGRRDYARSTPGDDGSITFVSRGQYASDDGAVTTEATAGWGNDEWGGVIATYDDAGRDMAMKEFYNQNGGLIQQAWGESTLDTDWLSWIDEATSQNLADLTFDPALSAAPDNVYLFYHWNGSGHEVWVSLDDDFSDSDNVKLDGTDIWNVYYKADTTWSAGDTVYNWDGDGSLTANPDGDGDVSGWRVSYRKGYEVPAAQTIFDGSYYLRNQFPLKTLLPLAGAYEENTVRREEGETGTYTWDEEEYSYTHYTYFIDANDSGTLDRENGDVILDNVWLNENWIWDPETDEITIVKAPFLSTTGTNLPSYLSAPDQTVIAGIESEIDAAYTAGMSEISLDDLPIQDISDRPEFADLRD